MNIHNIVFKRNVRARDVCTLNASVKTMCMHTWGIREVCHMVPLDCAKVTDDILNEWTI